MRIEAKLASLKDTQPHQYALRFLFGGLCTVMAGLIAKRFGPGIGGLFLAFPAIFPAGASLIEDHEKRKKQKAHLDGTNRGRVVAGVDAAGTSLGCLGLTGFACVLWRWLPGHNSLLVILSATLVWSLISVTLWLLSKSPLTRSKHRKSTHHLPVS
jgi:4-hydroxybenzoate polyprenyltransferase